MRKIALITMLLSALVSGGLKAQNFVSTEIQKRNVIIEEYTGKHCSWCPEGQMTANAIAKNNPGKVAALAHSEEKLAAKEQTLEELSEQIEQMTIELNRSNARTVEMFGFMRRSLASIAVAFAVELIASAVAVALLVSWILNHV